MYELNMKTVRYVRDEDLIELVERFKEIFMEDIEDIVMVMVEPNV
jgi:hypothetical protein